MVLHELPPVYDERSRVLILGSFPSPKSRETGFYYGHPQNRFWKALSMALGEPCPGSIPEKKAFLKKNGIALWDVVASCDIVGAGDNTIKNALPNDFSVILSAADIRAVFTTGRTATGLYRKFTGKESVMLPSPSPANCAVSLEELAEKYKTVAFYLKGEDDDRFR